MPSKACTKCGRRSVDGRCELHQLRPRPRGNAFEPTRQRIAARDRWTCQLCGEPIDPTLRRPHPRALNIHHVDEFAAGGSDADSNLAASHAECNQREGER